MKSIKNDKGKGKGKTFAPFAPFARLMTRRLTAAFSAALLTTAMLTTALFFASCGDSGASEDMAAPTNLPSTASSKLSITPASQHLIPGDSVKFTVKMIVGSENKDVTKDASLIIAGSHDNDTKISNGTLTVSNNEAAGRLSISGTYKDANVTVFVEVIDPSKKSIKEKFGITTEKTDAVSDTFTALHKFIQADGLVKLPEVIKPGDWIELEGGLTVAEYGDGEGKAGGFSYSYNDESWNKEIMITLNKGEWTESVSRGKLNRLIVVGINSFQTGKGYPVGSYTYPAGGDTPPPHVVFQFQNIPVLRRMNLTGINAGGYPASEMRAYLTPVDGVEWSGNFLTGLKNAGVPDGVLWAPARMVSAQSAYSQVSYTAAVTKIEDKLWLPTEYEMFGKNNQSVAVDETKDNQAWFEYYGTGNTEASFIAHRKFDMSFFSEYLTYPTKSETDLAKAYWLASADKVSADKFIYVNTNGAGSKAYAASSKTRGVAPAFCVR